MKFEKNIIPVFTGIAKAEEILSNISDINAYHITAVKTGIPCLIMNGKLCSCNGDEIKNEKLQNKFAWFVRRATMCKAIVVCTLYSDNLNNTYRKTYSPEVYKYVYGQEYFKRMCDEVKLELIDILPLNGRDLEFKYRLKMLESMSKNFDESIDNVSTPQAIESAENKVSDIIDFVLKNSKEGKLTLFSYNQSKFAYKYAGEAVPRYFKLDAFEVLKMKIKELKTSMTEDPRDVSQKIETIDFVRIDHPEILVSVPMLMFNSISSNKIITMRKAGLINFVLFRAIKMGGRILHPTPL